MSHVNSASADIATMTTTTTARMDMYVAADVTQLFISSPYPSFCHSTRLVSEGHLLHLPVGPFLDRMI